MIRYCISTATPVQAVQKPDGEWTTEGIAAHNYIEQMHLTQEFCKPFNTTFYMTSSAEECLDRLRDNISDATSVFMPIESISPYFIVPQPLFSGKLQYVTGYNITDGEQKLKDTATVASNADLLKPAVYLWSLFLLSSFVTLIAVRTWMIHSGSPRWARISLSKMIWRQWALMFYHNSVRFKWITFLYSLLCFYIVTSFLCLYKTSHIIMDKPFYAKNYQESLDHKSSLAFYYDQFTVVSTTFKNSPPDSLRGKLWAKLAATGRQDDYAGATTNPETLPSILKKGSEEMTVRRGICLAAPLIIPLIRSLACGFSPEGELWIVKMIADPIEQEEIYGHALSSHFALPRFFSVRMRSLFETHFLAHLYNKALDQSEMASSMVGSSKSHQWKQKVVCDNEDAFAPKPQVQAINLNYFRSFFTACVVVWLFAFILNISQIACAKNKCPIRTRRRVRPSTSA